MGTITLVGGAIVVGLALATDANGTVYMITAVISVRGITWLVKKITQTISQDSSEIIDFAGWCVAGVSVIGILKNSLGSVKSVTDFLTGIVNGVSSVGTWLNDFVDKITFWN